MDEHGVTVRDLGSRNGTSVDGAPIDGEVAIAPGARVEIGETTLVLADLAQADHDTVPAAPPSDPSVAAGSSEAGGVASAVSQVASRIEARTVDLAGRGDADRERLRALYGIGRALAGALEAPTVVESALEACAAAMGARGGAVFLADRDGADTLREVRRVGSFPTLGSEPGGGAAPDAWARAALRESLERARAGEATATEPLGAGPAGDVLLCAPLLGREAPLGAIAVVGPRPTAVAREADLEFLTEAGRLTALSLEGARTHARAREEAATLGQLVRGDGGIIGRAPALLAALEVADRSAASDASVLIRGETGTGKELLARRIHRRSRRGEGPFVALNCGAIARGVIESELFGHERGAFTGAQRRRAGLFEAAAGGTLFLDELGELPEDVQPKLLRVLQERKVLRVGATEPIEVDVRVLAATNRSVDSDAGFRRDLYFRLAVVTVTLPPLRERPDDIPELARHLLGRVAERIGRRAPELEDAAIETLCARSWPGNVRELENILERAIVLSPPGEPLGASLFAEAPGDPRVEVPGDVDSPATLEAASPTAGELSTLRDLEREHVARVLERTGGTRKEAARILGVSLPTLRKKIRDYGLEDPKDV